MVAVVIAILVRLFNYLFEAETECTVNNSHLIQFDSSPVSSLETIPEASETISIISLIIGVFLTFVHKHKCCILVVIVAVIIVAAIGIVTKRVRRGVRVHIISTGRKYTMSTSSL